MTKLPLSQPQLEILAHKLVEERQAAISGRKNLKLDSIWEAARAQYKGKEFTSVDAKSESLNTPLSSFKFDTDDQRSTVFVNITRPYTNAGTARVADILLPTGKMPFELKQTPVSDLEILKGVIDNYPEVGSIITSAMPELAQKLNQPEESAKAALELAGRLITDWLKESNWSGAVRQQIVEAGIVGTGIIKGPFPKSRAISQDVSMLMGSLPFLATDPTVGKLISDELQNMLLYTPQIECVAVENCYPDPQCGGDVQNGRYFYERMPEVTRRQLAEMKDDPSYLSDAIDACIEEGPKPTVPDKKSHTEKSRGPFEVWIRTGDIKVEDDNIGFCVTFLCNDRVIKVAEFWLESKIIPYWTLAWEPRDECWAGIGIPEQIETPQRGLNGSVRALMDNMGFSVGPQVLELDGLIEPVDGEDWKMRPYKRWRVKSGLPGVDAMTEAKNALAFLEFPNYLNEIMPVIQYWLKMAEDTTGLSLLLQGQAVTDAVGVSQQLMNNSTTNLRLIVKAWDDKTCRPMMNAFYEWTQLYGPAAAKGDGVVEPLGSTTLIVKELQQQALLQIGQQVVQPIYGISPKKWMQIYLEGFQIDAEKLAISEEEMAQLQAAESKPDPRVEAAQIEAQATTYTADLKHQVDMLKVTLDAQFKELSVRQAMTEAALTAQTDMLKQALANKGNVEKQAVAGASNLESQRMGLTADPEKTSPPKTNTQMELGGPEPGPDMVEPTDVAAALDTLGLGI
jgi:hypothetical protein